MSFTGQVVGSVVARLPASVIRAMASQYTAGASVEEAMAEVISLEQRGNRRQSRPGRAKSDHDRRRVRGTRLHRRGRHGADRLRRRDARPRAHGSSFPSERVRRRTGLPARHPDRWVDVVADQHARRGAGSSRWMASPCAVPAMAPGT